MFALCRQSIGVCLGTSLSLLSAVLAVSPAAADEITSPPIIHNVQGSADRIELTVNSSRILTMEQKIPRAQVNNPDLLDLTPLSATQIQVHAKKTGVTQVNLWDERGRIHSIDVIVYGDARELARILQVQFPTSTIKVFPTANSVILSGFVDRPDYVSRMVRMAEDYYPKVINNITVGGAQQILLHVRVVEVSRTKLRDLGFDFANISGGGSDFAASGISGLLGSLSRNGAGAITTVGAGPASTFTFGIVDPNNAFFGVLRALQRNSLMKVLAEPTLVTVSGRPAYFQAGGEIPVLIPQGLGTVAVEYRRFGTQVDFVPVVLGNGNVRLEVRPRVSELDNSISVSLNGTTIPGFRTREVDTGVELRTGETLALAGLIQQRLETQKSGVPWLGDLPYVGVPFRRVTETTNEVELLIMVRPEVAEGMSCEETPPGGPGMGTMSPSNWDLYMRGYMEVPVGHPDVTPMPQSGAHHMQHGGMPGMQYGPGVQYGPGPQGPVPQGTYYETVPTPAESSSVPQSRMTAPQPPMSHQPSAAIPASAVQVKSAPASAPKPQQQQVQPQPRLQQETLPQPAEDDGFSSRRSTVRQAAAQPDNRQNQNISAKPAPAQRASAGTTDSTGPGLIGPIGYDVNK